MAFVPSKDLPSLHRSRGERSGVTIEAIQRGLDQIARALNTVEDEEEHYWYGGKEGQEEVGEEVNQLDEQHTFEERCSKDWLLNVSCMRWKSIEDQAEGGGEEEGIIEEILRQAARLLAIFAGKSASGKSQRVYHFETVASRQVSIRVQEQVLLEDALGSRTWGSAPLLASRLLQRHFPIDMAARCKLTDPVTSNKSKIRVLELGAGTGLVGLAVAQFLKDSVTISNPIEVEVILTDFQKDVLVNLEGNVALNGWRDEEDSDSTVQVYVSPLDWSDNLSDKVKGRFDIIIAAADHADLIKSMVERYLSLAPLAKLYLCCPLRPTHQAEMEGIRHVFSPSPEDSSSDALFTITHQQDISGYDDFGPPLMELGQSTRRRQGRQGDYREFIIQNGVKP